MRISKEELKKRVIKAYSILKSCTLCPRKCRVNRLKNEIGICRTGSKAIVSSFGLHFGEERVLVGGRGSGTVFFSGCSLRCVFCQNYTISQYVEGTPISNLNLAKIFILLQKQGAININLVTPTHVVPMILEALYIAYNELKIPIVYNSSGYDSIETLKLLDGVVDIYMPDFKYGDNAKALKYSGVKNYFDVAKEAIKEMQRQVGDLTIENGIAIKGLLVRHLVLPNGLADSKKVLDVIKNEISNNAYVNVMDQYYPTYRAYEFPELSRRITFKEYEEVRNYALSLGLRLAC
uniref:Radical SAM protein n=1 Tax=candidate division WOR-3 bacterium TaxID=2052148 RepID=A0A7V3ZWI4_UNCW3